MAPQSAAPGQEWSPNQDLQRGQSLEAERGRTLRRAKENPRKRQRSQPPQSKGTAKARRIVVLARLVILWNGLCTSGATAVGVFRILIAAIASRLAAARIWCSASKSGKPGSLWQGVLFFLRNLRRVQGCLRRRLLRLVLGELTRRTRTSNWSISWAPSAILCTSGVFLTWGWLRSLMSVICERPVSAGLALFLLGTMPQYGAHMMQARKLGHVPGWTERIGMRAHERSYYEDCVMADGPSSRAWQGSGAPQDFATGQDPSETWELLHLREDLRVPAMSAEWQDDRWDAYEVKVIWVSQYHLKRTYLEMPGCRRRLMDERVAWRGLPVRECNPEEMYVVTDRLLTWTREGWVLDLRRQTFSKEMLRHIARMAGRESLSQRMLQIFMRQPLWETETSASLRRSLVAEMQLAEEILRANRERQRLRGARVVSRGNGDWAAPWVTRW